jgi:hypothetical protein
MDKWLLLSFALAQFGQTLMLVGLLFKRPARSAGVLDFDALKIEPGSTVMLRSEEFLTDVKREAFEKWASETTARTGIKFVYLPTANWDAVVIGAAE